MLDALIDLVLPRSCAGCDLPGTALCPSCRGLLAGPVLGAVRPRPCPDGLPTVIAALPYQGPAQRLLLAHKERGRLSLTAPLGTAIANGVLDLAVDGPIVLVPVPSSKAAVRARGHDHAMRLTRAAARSLRARGTPARADRLLVPARRVADQSGLSTAQRASNLAGALRGVGEPARVVVVDDVMTTGATLVEAARALRRQGHDVLGAAVVAATERTSPKWV